MGATADYVYLTADLLTGQIGTELPCSAGVKYSNAVNGWGGWSGAVKLSGRDPVVVADIVSATTPGRSVVYTIRNGVIEHGAILWGRRYDTTSRSLVLDGAELLSYLDHIFITDDLVFAAADQFTIAEALINYAMSKPGADVGLFRDTPGILSGVLRDRTYQKHEGASVAARLLELTQVDQGFDIRTSCAFDANGAILRRLVLGYPTLGRPYKSSQLTFEVDAQVVGLATAEDGTMLANSVTAIGAVPPGSDEATAVPPMVNVVDPNAGSFGWARLERVDTYTDISDQATLTGHATATLAAVRLPATTGALKIRGALDDPSLGGYGVGDEARVRVFGDPRWPGGLESFARISDVGVTVLGTSEQIDAGLVIPDLLTGLGSGTAQGTAYGPDKVLNGTFESPLDLTYWAPSWWIGATPATAAVDTVTPMSGLQSAKLSEVAGAFTRYAYTVVFPVLPGQVYDLHASFRSNCPPASWPTDAQVELMMPMGINPTGPGSPFMIFDPDVLYVDAARIDNVPTQQTIVASGQLTVPSDKPWAWAALYCNFWFLTAAPAIPWTWELDEVSCRQKLT